MPDLDLPRGPLTRHLREMHNLVTYIAQRAILPADVVGSDLVLAHAGHARAVAEYTADRPRQGGPTPPRPEPITDEDLNSEGGREGWDRLVVAADGTVLAGWTTDGDFYAWSPTEVIARTLCETIMVALTIGEGHRHG